MNGRMIGIWLAAWAITLMLGGGFFLGIIVGAGLMAVDVKLIQPAQRKRKG